MRVVLSMVLVLAVVATGMPLRHACDVNGSGAVDLADVVVQMQRFSQAAEDPAGFSAAVSDAITTLNVVAGFKRIITQGDASNGSASVQPSLERPYLLSTMLLPVDAGMEQTLVESTKIYRSITLPPETPPPIA